MGPFGVSWLTSGGKLGHTVPHLHGRQEPCQHPVSAKKRRLRVRRGHKKGG